LGQSAGGHVRNPIEPPVACIRVAGTRHIGAGVRCLEHGLDGNGSVCLPATSFAEQGPGENRTATVPGDIDSPVLVGAAVVPAPPSFASGRAGVAASNPGSTQSATEADGLAFEAGSVPTSRVEVVKSSLRGRGFSERIAKLVSTAKRPSTEAVYQCHWKAWVRWAAERDCNPMAPTVNDLAEYFLYLVQERKLKVQTVKSHRSSIFTTLRQCGRRDFSSNLVLHDLLKSLQSTVERPTILPKWDVFLVLHALKGPPYEPLRFASLRSLTWKTLFLVSLAACRRISEIHGFCMTWWIITRTIQLYFGPIRCLWRKTRRQGRSFPRQSFIVFPVRCPPTIQIDFFVRFVH